MFLTRYIRVRIYNLTGEWPPDNAIVRYARDVYGIENFVPREWEGPGGSFLYYYRVLSEEETDGGICTTVQFYADHSRTIKSQKMPSILKRWGAITGLRAGWCWRTRGLRRAISPHKAALLWRFVLPNLLKMAELKR